ncbi:MAG: helix-turn-helix domain-containing protein [Firmicutes bacterium]|nr:helix-turn-helix domain-containing protein [Bacillota bacterium]
MTVGKKIKDARKSQNISQADLASKAGLSRSYLGDVERDRYNPSVETLMRIAQGLNTEAGHLMDGIVSQKLRDEKAEFLAFDRREFRGLTPDEIETLAGIAAMFKKARTGREKE